MAASGVPSWSGALVADAPAGGAHLRLSGAAAPATGRCPTFILRDVAPEDLDDFQRGGRPPRFGEPARRSGRARARSSSGRSGRSRAQLPSRAPTAASCSSRATRTRGARGRDVDDLRAARQPRARRTSTSTCIEEERYSETLDRHFSHRVLRIGYNYKGLTEIGGLVVRPEFRGHPRAAGPAARRSCASSTSRLHRGVFRDEVVSELMPPLEPDGTSLLWESLGRQLHGPHLPGGGRAVAAEQGVHPRAVSRRIRSTRRCCRRTCRS